VDRNVPRGACHDGVCGGDGRASSADAKELREHGVERGTWWVVGGFVFCPCHLPLTLWVLATLLAGTTLGALLREHVVIAAALISSVWILATWRGLWLLRAARGTQR
jgi:hypothetical protein